MKDKSNIGNQDTSYASAIFISTFILVFGILLCYMPKNMSSDNTMYAIEQLHTYDHELYNNNVLFVLNEVTPRIALNHLVAFAMVMFKCEWEIIAIILIYLGLLPFAYAIVNTSFRLFDLTYVPLLSTVFAFYIGNGLEMGMANFGNVIPDLGLGAGFGFSLAAISNVIGKKPHWNFAWILLAFSLLFHIHEAIWGFATLILLWILETNRNKKINYKELQGGLVFIIITLIYLIPCFISDKSLLSDEEFVYIYANLRTPHHLLPSAYGIKSIIRYFCLLIYPSVLYLQTLKNKKHEMKQAKICVFFLLFVWLMALSCTYIFTEIYPSSFIVTAMIPKFFKYISMLFLIFYLIVIENYFKKKNIVIAFSIIVFSVTVYSMGTVEGGLVFLGLLSLIQCFLKKDSFNNYLLIAYMVFCSYIAFLYSNTNQIITVSFILLLFFFIKKNKFHFFNKMITRVCIPILIIVISGKLFILQDETIRPITSKDYIVSSTTNDIYDLATAFKIKTEKDSMFLADPMDASTGWFQLIARRR